MSLQLEDWFVQQGGKCHCSSMLRDAQGACDRFFTRLQD